MAKRERSLRWAGNNHAIREHYAALAAHPPQSKPKKAKRKKGKPRPVNRSDFASYADYLQSKWWRVRRKQAIANAGRRCQRCGIRGKLQVHHKNYERVGRERKQDLEVLCEGCHRGEHKAIIEMDAHLARI